MFKRSSQREGEAAAEPSRLDHAARSDALFDLCDDLFRALNDIGYAGPLSVEWEDSGMDREFGAAEAARFVRAADFAPSGVAFDAPLQRLTDS